MRIPRLAALTGLAVLGALCAGTAASVYTASIPSRELQAGPMTEAWHIGADPTDPLLLQLSPEAAAEGLAYGACLQIREMLFGVSAERWAAFDSVTAVKGPAQPRLRARLREFDQASLSGRVAQCRR